MRPAMGRTALVVWLIAAVSAVLLGTSGRASASLTPLPAQASYCYDGSPQLSAPTAALRTRTTWADARSTERAAKVATRSHAGAAAGFAPEKVASPGTGLVKYSYPPNRGFLGGPVRTTLKPGTVVDRYGADSGTFVSRQGTPFAQRALPPSSLEKPFNTYEVVNPIEVNGGTDAPWFGQGGGGIQYQFDSPIADLIEGGFLKAVGR